MRIGVDLGGTKIEAVVLDGNEVRARRRIATPAGDYAATLDAIVALVQALEAELGARDLPVGIGHPGSLTPGSGVLRNANSTCLNGRPFADDLALRLGRRPKLANDANCLAASEAHDGAAAGVDAAFCVILGTGVGGAIVHQGRVLTGANALAGEWGHNPLPWMRAEEYPGPACWCGQVGCLETWLSGPALSRDYASVTGQHVAAVDIVARCADGEPATGLVLDRYADRLARALAMVINLLDPDVIVLAGGLSRWDSLYDEIPTRWGQWVFAESVSTRLVPARHGDASGVLGAARLE